MAANTPTYWASDVSISMPMPPRQPVSVLMDGFVFTEGGMAHDINEETYLRLSTPDFKPEVMDRDVVWEDTDVDQPPASMEVF
jgi:hypothetical protein